MQHYLYIVTKHLKSRDYYSELYDKGTIRECLWWEKNADSDKLESLKDDDPKKSALKKEAAKLLVAPIAVYAIKGERHANKAETIREWMERDQAKDEQIEGAVVPRSARCLGCSGPMKEESRTLMTNERDHEEVVFMFSCDRCDKRRAYWESGQEWEVRPSPCPKCQTHMTRENGRGDKVLTTTYSCPNCEYSNVDTIELTHTEPEVDSNFEANRKKYCLSEKEGAEYIDSREKLKHFSEMTKERKENKEVYDALAKLKKLNIAELQNALRQPIEKAGYTNFELGKPEMQRDVIVEFTAQDNKAERGEYDSRMDLKKTVEQTLANTNWRLMSDGISYRLGLVSGRLRGVEGEESLKKLVAKKK